MKNRNRSIVVVASLAVGLGAGYAIRAVASGIPSTAALTYSGMLETASGPANGSFAIQLVLYDAPTGGNSLCNTLTEGDAGTSFTVTDGHFSVQLPDQCTAAVGANPNVYVDVLVGGVDIGRTKIGAVPYAVEANHAPNADNANNAAVGGGIASSISALQAEIANLADAGAAQQQATSAIQGGSMVAVEAAANVSVPNGTFTNLPFATVDWDVLGEYSVANGFTPLNTGYYQVCGSVFWTATVVESEIDAFINGVRFRAMANGANTYIVGGCLDVHLTAGQHLTVQTWQGSGATQTIQVAPLWTYLNIHRIF